MPHVLSRSLPSRRGSRHPARTARIWLLAALAAVLLTAPWTLCHLSDGGERCAGPAEADTAWVSDTVRNARSVLAEGVDTATDLITR